MRVWDTWEMSSIETVLRLWQSSRPAEARVACAELLRADPENFDPLKFFAVTSVGAREYNAAIDSLTRAIALRPADPRAHNNLGNTFREAGRLREAIDSYERAIALSPGYADAHYNVGNALLNDGRAEDAVAAYER